jgi:hypothetical protein
VPEEDELEPLLRVERIEMMIDARIQDILKDAHDYFEGDEDDLKFVSALVRAAYGYGITRAINYPTETIKEIKALGYRMPKE